MYEYAGEITRVVDGDTVHARVDLGCDVRLDMTLRLYGIDTPELPTPEGIAAKDWLAGELTGRVVIRTLKDRREKYGRYLAIIFAHGTEAESANDALVRLGLARVYLP